MKDILSKLYEATGTTVDRLDSDATINNDVALREALQTEEIEGGIRVGRWDILENDGGYDVVHSVTRQAIAGDLRLYDAALGIVRHLNEGGMINDNRIRELLDLEDEFARNHDNAVQFNTQKNRFFESGNEAKAAIVEDRMEDYMRRADDSKDRLLKLAGVIR